MRYQNWKFFDKNGHPLNFNYDTTNGKWTGGIYLPKVSVNLFEVTQLFIVEEFINSDGDVVYKKPHINDSQLSLTSSASNIILEWTNDYPKEIFLFDFDSTLKIPVLNKFEELEITIDSDSNEYISTDSNIKHSNILTDEILQINIAINSIEENIYERTLIIRDSLDGLPIAEILFYGETVDKDERLEINSRDLGYDINSDDYTIFKESDINEAIPDQSLLNSKRKEILLEGSNIMPYIGSYKALINAIKFYGYDDLVVKEYWKNVDINSSFYGKYKHSRVLDIFDSNVNLNDESNQLPNLSYRKTNLFGLYYRINRVKTGYFDEYDMPITEDVFAYTLEEALIKLYGLKNKLKEKYLPFSSKIIDIVGEADYFAKKKITTSISINRTESIIAGITPSFKVTPGTEGYIQDLRDIEDLKLPSYTPRNVPHDILANSSYTVQELSDVLLAYFQKYYPNLNTSIQLPDSENIPVGYPIVLENTSFDLTWDEMNITWDELNTGASHIFDFEAENITTGDTFIITDTVSGESIQYTSVLGDTDEDVANGLKAQWSPLSTSPWNKFILSVVNTDTGFALRAKGVGTGAILLPVDFQTSTINGSLSSTQQLNKKIVSVSNIFTWDNLLRGNFYDMEWIVSKKETDTPAYVYQIRGDIRDYEKIAVILPYTGKYNVELKLYDTFNQVSSLIKEDYITVESKEVEFTGFYTFREKEYTWNNSKLTWDEYTSTWDNPIHPKSKIEEVELKWYESLDRINGFIDSIKYDDANFSIQNYQSDGQISVNGPYTWDNMTGSWDDCYHLTWDSMNVTGDTPSSFNIDYITAGGLIELNFEPRKYQFHPKNIQEGDIFTITENETNTKFSVTAINNSSKKLCDELLRVWKTKRRFPWRNYDVIVKRNDFNYYLEVSEKKGNTILINNIFQATVNGVTGGSQLFDLIFIKPIKKGTHNFSLSTFGDNLSNAAAELNNSKDKYFSRFIFNKVLNSIDNVMYIQAVAKYQGSYGDFYSLTTLGPPVVVSKQKCSITGNPTWDNLRILNFDTILPKMVYISFVYDKCKIPGKTNAKWTIINESDPNWTPLIFEGRWMNYLFKEAGNYTISLYLTDSNGNPKETKKNTLTIK